MAYGLNILKGAIGFILSLGKFEFCIMADCVMTTVKFLSVHNITEAGARCHIFVLHQIMKTYFISIASKVVTIVKTQGNRVTFVPVLLCTWQASVHGWSPDEIMYGGYSFNYLLTSIKTRHTTLIQGNRFDY